MKNFFLIFIVLKIFKYSQSGVLSAINQNIIKSFNKELNIKHFCLLKNDNFQTDFKILNLVKEFSRESICVSSLSISEMKFSMQEYYKTPHENYFFKNLNKGYQIEKKREKWVYPPKTVVIIHGSDIEKTVNDLFTHDNEFSVSRYLWLIFDESGELFENEMNGYIPYNCQFFLVKTAANNTDIMEIYHPSRTASKPFKRIFGIWKENENKIAIFKPNIFERRFDLNGTLLLTSPLTPGNHIEFFCYIFMNYISETMNFRMAIVPSNNDTVYEFHSIFSFMYSENFFPFLLWPLWKEPINLYISYDEKYEQHGISPFLRPFSYNLWLAVIALIIISEIIIIIIFYFTKKILQTKIFLSNILYEPLESFLNQCGSETPKKSSVKFVSAAVRLAALILVPAYTGAILSFILTPTIEFPFLNIKEFVEDGTYKLGYIKSLNGAILFKRSNDPWMKAAYENYSESIDGDAETALAKAIQRLCHDHKFALLSFDTQVDKGCETLKIPSPVFSGWLAIYLRHESPYTSAFNHVLKTFHSCGIVKRFKSYIEELKKAFGLMENLTKERETNSVKIIGVKTVFIITGILYLISVMMLFAEICIRIMLSGK